MSLGKVDRNKPVHIIVHGQSNLIDPVKGKLGGAGFDTEQMKVASMQNTGSIGDYVAMVWPPMPNAQKREVIISQISSTAKNAWSLENLKEITRIPL